MPKQEALVWKSVDLSTLPAALRKQAETIMSAERDLADLKKAFNTAFFAASKTLDADLHRLGWGKGWSAGTLSIARLAEPKSKAKKGEFSFS